MKINKQNKNGKDVSVVYGNNNSISVNIFNNKILMEVVGSFNSNLKELEKITGSKIYFRGNSIAIKGDKNANEKVKDAIEYLIYRFRSDEKIDRNDIITALNTDMVQDTKNQSKIQSIGEIIKTPKRSVIPRTKKQKEYVKALRNSEIVMSLGPAGTGKTYLAVAVALTMLLEENEIRLKKLQNRLENFQYINNKKYLHKSCEVLIENKLDNQEKYFGRTKYMTPVIFESDNGKFGELVNVQITSCNQNNLFGVHKINKVEAA